MFAIKPPESFSSAQPKNAIAFLGKIFCQHICGVIAIAVIPVEKNTIYLLCIG